MIWLTWRQHRQHLVAALAMLTVLAAAYLALRAGLSRYVHDSGLATCLNQPDEGCGHLIDGLMEKYPALLGLLPYLNLVPILAGVFVGAPLVTRELDRGTDRLVWTQSVSRRRWLLTKVALLGAGCLAVGFAFGLLNRWFLEPYFAGAAVSPVAQDYLGLTGLAPAAYTFFAFALGIAAGALLRRPLPAMALTLGLFVVARLGWESLRYSLLPPLRSVTAIGSATPVGPGRRDWLLPVSPWVDAGGAPLDDGVFNGWCGQSPTKQAFQECLASHGVHEATYWEPATRYWTFQWIDVAVAGSVAVGLLALAVAVTMRRRG